MATLVDHELPVVESAKREPKYDVASPIWCFATLVDVGLRRCVTLDGRESRAENQGISEATEG